MNFDIDFRGERMELHFQTEHDIGHVSYRCTLALSLRPDFTSNLVHELPFGTPKFYIVPYGKIDHGLFNLSFNCDVKSGLSVALFLVLV